jgi:hypothetical protein
MQSLTGTMLYLVLYMVLVTLCYCFYRNFFGLSYCSYCLSHRELLQEVLEKGHSRVPVYYEKKTNIIGLILVILFSVKIQSLSLIE